MDPIQITCCGVTVRHRRFWSEMHYGWRRRKTRTYESGGGAATCKGDVAATSVVATPPLQRVCLGIVERVALDVTLTYLMPSFSSTSSSPSSSSSQILLAECDTTFRLQKRGVFDGSAEDADVYDAYSNDDDIVIDDVVSNPAGVRIVAEQHAVCDALGRPPIHDIKALMHSLFYTTDDDILMPQ